MDEVEQMGDEITTLKNIQTQAEILADLVRKELAVIQTRRINAIKVRMQQQGGGVNEDRGN